MTEIENLNVIEKIIDSCDRFFNSSAATKILGRLLFIITAPIWCSLMVIFGVLVLLYSGIIAIVLTIPYWIITGKDIMKSKYNIFNI